MNMKRLFAIVACILLIASLSACTGKPNTVPNPPAEGTSLTPKAQDATGSIFIGTWTVSAKTSVLDKISFDKNGTLQAHFDNSKLGGVFFDDGAKLSMYISQKTIEGTYTVEGDVVTVVTADDVLVLTKA